MLVGLSVSAQSQSPTLSLELNKLEAQENGCRAYFVVDNTSTTAYQALKLAFVLFGPDAVIVREFALDLAPLQAAKRTVKRFDLDGTGCDKVGTLLVNNVIDCKSDAGPLDNCMSNMALSSLTNVQLTK